MDLQVIKTETFETAYSINAEVKQQENNEWTDKILPLKSLDSKNDSLLQQWNKLVKAGKIKEGTRIRIKTWLGISKNNHAIRRFEIEV